MKTRKTILASILAGLLATLLISATHYALLTQASTTIEATETTFFSENFDGVTPPALPPGWTATNATGPAPLWVTSNSGTPPPPADSLPNAAFIDDPAVVSDKHFDSPSIFIPSSPACLTFLNNYDLENSELGAPDGGVLEISIGGGGFTDIITAGGTFATGGYNAGIGGGNPLAGRMAWSGFSGGFITTQVNLPAATAGQSIVLRWRLGSDSVGSRPGWRIDSVSITDNICVIPPTPTPTPAPTPVPVPPCMQGSSSTNVAIIGSPDSINGGFLPTTGADLAGITFTNLAPANVNAANLLPFDTAILNVASSQMGCTTATLTPAAKADLVAFVALGKKLIIYDSECPTVDYSWLPYPFTTNNPGQAGANGTLTIVEENTLSSNNPSSPYYINAGAISTSTDAVGDSNVFVTFDPHWCLDMSATNVQMLTGATHTYAKFPLGTDTGLFIYNGLDIDAMADEPGASGSRQLRRVYVLELRQCFNPSNLPCGFTPVGITLAPATATNPVGTTHTVTATLTDLLGAPQPGILVIFTILSGPNAGASGTCTPPNCTTDANGRVSFTYTGSGGVGTDIIKACFTGGGGMQVCSQEVTKIWTCTITCPANITVSNDPTHCGATVNYPAPTAVSCGAVTCTPASGSFFPVGTTTVNCTTQAGPSCSFTVTVNDTENPVITCPPNKTVPNDPGLCSATVNPGTATATDNCPGVTVMGTRNDGQPLTAPYPVGTTTINWKATDAAQHMATCSQTITVNDVEPPVITASVANNCLWPPNHDLMEVGLSLAVSDNCTTAAQIAVDVKVTSDERPEEPTGDGNFSPDAVVTGTGVNRTVKVRRERVGSRDGRVYLIRITATDQFNNPSLKVLRVDVPKNQNPHAQCAIDSRPVPGADAPDGGFFATSPPAPIIGNRN